MITLNYKDGRSLHMQIRDGLKELIINGILTENEQLPSVRELSVSLTVNPNTVQRAYRALEADGYIYSVQGKGSFVTAKIDRKELVDTDALYKQLVATAKELLLAGEECEELNRVIQNIYEEMGENND